MLAHAVYDGGGGGKTGSGQLALCPSCFLVSSFLILHPLYYNQVRPEHLNQLLHPQFKDDMTSSIYVSNVLTTGLPAAPGAAVGKIVFSPELAGETILSHQP